MIDYEDFLEQKRFTVQTAGFSVPPENINPELFPFQVDIVRWALRMGKAAIFADTGLGKTFCQLEWARLIHAQTGGRVIILAPLAVAQQTAREGQKWGIPAAYARNEAEAAGYAITVANYERLHLFDTSQYIAVALDESSILKSYSGATTKQLIETFARTPYRSAWTATPAPNDHEELGNHCEFLGVMTRTEMLAEYFVHDGGDTGKWRLKGHAQDVFWRFVAGWAVAIRKPSDLGYSDERYDLPPLNMIEHCIEVEAQQSTELFDLEAGTLTEQRTAKNESMTARIQRVAELVAMKPDEPWLIWCELNAESQALARAIPGAVEVTGSDPAEKKEQSMLSFTDGKIGVLITKPSICGFGMNWQHCANMAFVGVSNSYEQTYQAIRRCWRFGQTRPVTVHMVYGHKEAKIVRNLKRKQGDHEGMSNAMVATMREVSGISPVAGIKNEYVPAVQFELPSWIRGTA